MTLRDMFGNPLQVEGTLVDMPGQDTPSLPVRVAPQKFWDCSFSGVGSGLLTTDLTQIAIGAGMTVSQSSGKLVILSGTTANAEFVARSVDVFNGAMSFKAVTTLSQRIVNNNFYVELVDVIGDGLAYTIVNATTVDVTLTAHGYTAQNVGQRMDLCAITDAAGVPMEGVIASIPGVNTIRFTVAGWPASGSGTLSLTGWNKIELNYTGTSSTAVNFNTRRRGWQNTSVAAVTQTTASGVMSALMVQNGLTSLADKIITSAGAFANRASWDTNIPLPDLGLYIQIRARNGTTAPTSTTTWTLGMMRIEDYIPQQVSLVGVHVQSAQNSLPVSVIGTVPTTLSGTPPVSLASTIANSPAPAVVTDIASAALTTTTTTAAITPSTGPSYDVQFSVTAVTGTTPTLDVVIEESMDSGTTWIPVYHFPQITTTGNYRSPKMPCRGNRVRYVQTVAGTTQSFTRVVTRQQHADNVPDFRQAFDRSLNSSQALNAVTAVLIGGFCRNAHLVISAGTITTTPPAIQLECSDGTGVWYPIGSPLTAVANIGAQLTVSNINAPFVRAKVTTAGSGATLNWVLLKLF